MIRKEHNTDILHRACYRVKTHSSAVYVSAGDASTTKVLYGVGVLVPVK